jgi:hypothetical protein
MMGMDSNLRKAAVLIRSLDSDTAAVMLAQLSAEEAAKIRAAIREIGALDPEEQAAVAAEIPPTNGQVRQLLLRDGLNSWRVPRTKHWCGFWHANMRKQLPSFSRI